MKSRSISRPGKGEEGRSAANAYDAAPVRPAPAATMVDARASSLTQLQQQQIASKSSRTAQLMAHAGLMGGAGDAPAQRAQDDELVQGKMAPAQMVDDEELVQGKFEPVQRVEEEELVQGKFAPVQRVEEDELAQGKFAPAQRAERVNQTGLPNQLKSGIEALSGMSMDHVKVHYNSDKPAQMQAHAYAQGSEIHVAPGQEQHVPHEAWHVVQQAQGRVKPTMQLKAGIPVNDDAGLENEADVMGAQALAQGASDSALTVQQARDPAGAPVQRTILGAGHDHWAKNVKRVSGKKLDEFKSFLSTVHALDDIDFSLGEIEGFYDAQLANLSHSDMASDHAGKLKNLKRFAALARDDEGGHGAEKHGEPGDQFLVDRVNNARGNGAFTASSMNIDDFLQWDTLLARESEGIYATYAELAQDKLDGIVGSVANQGAIGDVGDLRTRARDLNADKEWKRYITQSTIVPRLTICTEIRTGLIALEGTPQKPVYSIPIGAEIQGLTELNGRSVSRANGGVQVAVEDVVPSMKRPEAYTGGLAPKYKVMPNGHQTGTPDKKTLEWVTKY